MFIEYSILSMMTLAIIASGIFQWKLRKFIANLPGNWKNVAEFKRFKNNAFLIWSYLVCCLLSESISEYLSSKWIYNSYVFSINFTVSTLFLFGFFFLNTRKNWKRYSYLLFYTIIVGYLIQGEYYHPKCVLPANSSLLIFSLYFLAALLHLTDLLFEHRSVHFQFQLRFNISLMICALLSVILTSFHWAETMTIQSPFSKIIFYLHLLNILGFYISLILIFIFETLKLRRG